MIYDMIQDNINLRLKINNYIDGILEQTNQKLEKYVSQSKKRIIIPANLGGQVKTTGEGLEERTKGGEFEKRKEKRAIVEENKKKTKGSRMCT